MVTGAGLGGSNQRQQSAIDCPGGTLYGGGALCAQVQGRGYAYKSRSVQVQGFRLGLRASTTIGPHTYLLRWQFADDGSIAPAIGLAGELPVLTADTAAADNGWPLDAAGTLAIGFTHHYFWRLDFDLGTGPAGDAVEELAVVPSSDRRRKTQSRISITSESQRRVDADSKRSWRILDTQISNADGRSISYHLEPLHSAHRNRGNLPALASDIHITKLNACERFSIANPTTGGCGANVADYVDGESLEGADIVLWYGLSYHHLPRSEDEPRLPVHWDGFVVVPRDWTATNPLVGAEQ